MSVWAFSDESERANLMLVGVLFAAAGDVNDSRRELRRLLLAAVANEVASRGAASWTLDNQDPHQAAQDRPTIERVFRHRACVPVYDHRPAVPEPMLWAVDAVVWAVGAGGDWHRRIGHLSESRVVEP